MVLPVYEFLKIYKFGYKHHDLLPAPLYQHLFSFFFGIFQDILVYYRNKKQLHFTKPFFSIFCSFFCIYNSQCHQISLYSVCSYLSGSFIGSFIFSFDEVIFLNISSYPHMRSPTYFRKVLFI